MLIHYIWTGWIAISYNRKAFPALARNPPVGVEREILAPKHANKGTSIHIINLLILLVDLFKILEFPKKKKKSAITWCRGMMMLDSPGRNVGQ